MSDEVRKKPDRATAEKIKKYLGDWVKVYSIYNVRGGVSNYDEEEERETLITSGILKAESLIRAEFKTILGDVYAGHVLTSSLRTPKFFVKEFSYFLMPCHQHGLGVNLLVQR